MRGSFLARILVKTSLTFEGRFHGRFDQPGEELQGLWILCQTRGEGCQSLRVFAKTLEGDALTVIGLEKNGRDLGIISTQVKSGN